MGIGLLRMKPKSLIVAYIRFLKKGFGMKSQSIKKIMFLFIAICICGNTSFSSELKELLTSEVNSLTAKKTVGLVFVRYSRDPWYLYKKSNVNAKNEIYKILNNRSLSMYRQPAFRILGIIGKNQDVEKIKQISLEIFRHPYDIYHESSALYGAFEALSILSLRGIKKADNVLLNMLKDDFWDN